MFGATVLLGLMIHNIVAVLGLPCFGGVLVWWVYRPLRCSKRPAAEGLLAHECSSKGAEAGGVGRERGGFVVLEVL